MGIDECSCLNQNWSKLNQISSSFPSCSISAQFTSFQIFVLGEEFSACAREGVSGAWNPSCSMQFFSSLTAVSVGVLVKVLSLPLPFPAIILPLIPFILLSYYFVHPVTETSQSWFSFLHQKRELYRSRPFVCREPEGKETSKKETRSKKERKGRFQGFRGDRTVHVRCEKLRRRGWTRVDGEERKILRGRRGRREVTFFHSFRSISFVLFLFSFINSTPSSQAQKCYIYANEFAKEERGLHIFSCTHSSCFLFHIGSILPLPVPFPPKVRSNIRPTSVSLSRAKVLSVLFCYPIRSLSSLLSLSLLQEH